MIRRIVRGGLAGIALWLATASPVAQATTVADLSLEQFADASTWIIEGRVLRVWTELDAERPDYVWTRAEVALDEILKGPGTPETLVIDSHGGRFGDVFQYQSGSAVYSVGERIFVFLDTVDRGRRLVPVARFHGKYTVRRAAYANELHVLQVPASKNPDTPYDHRFLPHPAEANRVLLSDLRAQVTARLAEGWDGKAIPGISLEKLAEINATPLPSADIPAGPESL